MKEEGRLNEQEQMKALWGADRKRFMLKYPDENVIRFLKKSYPDERKESIRIMDFGCGSGRNEMIMMDMKFEIFAVDYNVTCLDMTRKVAEERNYEKIHYILNDKTDICVPDHSIDCFLSLGGLFYFNREEREEFFWEMNRILKPGGITFADFRSIDDGMYGKGKQLEENFYCLENCGSLSGICYWFCGEKELRHLYESHGFHIYNFEKKDMYVNNMTERHSHYYVWAEKV